jgi:hypothetical protein
LPSSGHKKGEIRALLETTTAIVPTPVLTALARLESFLFPIPAKTLEIPLNNKATAASVIKIKAANTGNATAEAAARAITSIPITIWAVRCFL